MLQNTIYSMFTAAHLVAQNKSVLILNYNLNISLFSSSQTFFLPEQITLFQEYL